MRSLMVMVLCFVSSNVVFGGEAILRGMQTDGQKMTIFCTVEGDGATDEEEIFKQLYYIDVKIDVKKAKVTKDKEAGKITIEIPATTAPFTMTSVEVRRFGVAKGRTFERRTRTYHFTFREKQTGIPISSGDFQNFIINSVTTKDDERFRSEKVSDLGYLVELNYDE